MTTTLPNGARLEQGPGGLERLVVTRDEASAELFLQGAQLVHWQPAGHAPVLFTSTSAVFAPGKAIRGGIPICFPWFGPRADAPQHGFARTSPWRLVEVRENKTLHTTDAVLALDDDDVTRALWPHRFEATYTVSIGAKLELFLRVANTGETPFTFEEALHTYLAASDVSAIAVRGLEGAPFVDKARAGARAVEGDAPVTISGEVDRVYQHEAAAELDDPGRARRIGVQKDGSKTTILWSPGAEKGRAMRDLGDEWRSFVCIESGNADPDGVSLAPGESHVLAVRIVVNAAGR